MDFVESKHATARRSTVEQACNTMDFGGALSGLPPPLNIVFMLVLMHLGCTMCQALGSQGLWLPATTWYLPSQPSPHLKAPWDACSDPSEKVDISDVYFIQSGTSSRLRFSGMDLSEVTEGLRAGIYPKDLRSGAQKVLVLEELPRTNS